MAFKNFNRNLSFADLELVEVLTKNRTQGFLEEINRAIEWGAIQEALNQEYPVGQSTLGNKAYPLLTLLKAMLLQKWYGIDSDPELENQINDRLSFKRFIGIPLRQSAPGHSLIFRFRKRVTCRKSRSMIPTIFSRLPFEGCKARRWLLRFLPTRVIAVKTTENS